MLGVTASRVVAVVAGLVVSPLHGDDDDEQDGDADGEDGTRRQGGDGEDGQSIGSVCGVERGGDWINYSPSTEGTVPETDTQRKGGRRRWRKEPRHVAMMMRSR